MIEMLLESTKETDKKLRWGRETDDGVVFSLYIPKWRVPEPWPQRIYVKIELIGNAKSLKPRYTKEHFEEHPSLKTRPIVGVVRRVEEHTETLRYRPIGDDEWEIGEPYIPYSLTCDSAEYLKLTVDWDID